MGIKGLAKLLSDEAPEVSTILMVCVRGGMGLAA